MNRFYKKVLFISLLIFPGLLMAQDLQHKIEALAGTYVGEWTSYKKNLAGEFETATSWADTLIASDPVLTDSLAYVNIHSKSSFTNSAIPDYQLDFKEGFYILDGKIGNPFFNVMGKVTEQKKIDENTFVYSEKIHPQEFSQMRFFSAIEGYHTIVKIVLISEGKERHEVSRISTIQWLDSEGVVQNTQFVSLKGFHEKID